MKPILSRFLTTSIFLISSTSAAPTALIDNGKPTDLVFTEKPPLRSAEVKLVPISEAIMESSGEFYRKMLSDLRKNEPVTTTTEPAQIISTTTTATPVPTVGTLEKGATTTFDALLSSGKDFADDFFDDMAFETKLPDPDSLDEKNPNKSAYKLLTNMEKKILSDLTRRVREASFMNRKFLIHDVKKIFGLLNKTLEHDQTLGKATAIKKIETDLEAEEEKMKMEIAEDIPINTDAIFQFGIPSDTTTTIQAP